LVKSQHRFILLFDPGEVCKQKLLAMGRWFDKMLKEQRQIPYIRLQRLEPLVVTSSIRVFGHSEKKIWIRGLTLLTPQPIKIDNDDDQHTRDDALPESIDVQKVSSVVNGRQDKGSKQRAVHWPDRAASGLDPIANR
jgi:hypothetical protein